MRIQLHRLKKRLVWIVGLVVIPVLCNVQSVIAKTVPAVDQPGHQAAVAQINLGIAQKVALPGYVPRENRFQFTNEALTQALQANRDRPEWLSTFTLGLPELFGPQVCVGEDVGTDGKQCILTAAAQSWLDAQVDLMGQGVCDAIAATSLFLWEPTPTRLPWWQTLLNTLIPLSRSEITASNDVLQTWIANQALTQGLDEVYQPTQRVRETLSPREILGRIVQAFQDTPADPYTLGIYQRQGNQLTEGHSLLPYQVEALADGQYRVYVYDSNVPSNSRHTPFLQFDVEADTWVYQPTGLPPYNGDGQSQNLDLTRLSWRLPPSPAGQATTATTAAPDPAGDEATDADGAAQGPFTCPFCQGEQANQLITLGLVGEGQLTVEQFKPLTEEYVPIGNGLDRVPFKGGLERNVPANYVVPASGSDRPYKLLLSGTGNQPQTDLTLQVTGAGYTASFESLRLGPTETLTMYVSAGAQGPELTFEAQQPTSIPHLTIYLEDDLSESSPLPAGLAASETPASPEAVITNQNTRYQKHVSYSFDISGISLPAGRSVALSVDQSAKRFYFADNDDRLNRYTLNIVGRTREEQATDVETREDFANGEFEITTRTERRIRRYEESLNISRVEVGDQLAYFDYGDWAQIPSIGADLSDVTAAVDVPIVYSSLPTAASKGKPLSLNPQTAATQTRVYRGNLIKSNYR